MHDQNCCRTDDTSSYHTTTSSTVARPDNRPSPPPSIRRRPQQRRASSDHLSPPGLQRDDCVRRSAGIICHRVYCARRALRRGQEVGEQPRCNASSGPHVTHCERVTAVLYGSPPPASPLPQRRLRDPRIARWRRIGTRRAGAWLVVVWRAGRPPDLPSHPIPPHPTVRPGRTAQNTQPPPPRRPT